VLSRLFYREKKSIFKFTIKENPIGFSWKKFAFNIFDSSANNIAAVAILMRIFA